MKHSFTLIPLGEKKKKKLLKIHQKVNQDAFLKNLFSERLHLCIPGKLTNLLTSIDPVQTQT